LLTHAVAPVAAMSVGTRSTPIGIVVTTPSVPGSI
jgi:hypothetical protein